MNILYLSWRHARYHPVQTAVLTACLALTIFLPAATHWLVRDYEAQLIARANDTPLIAGTKGNRFDLTLAALYFRPSALEPIPFSELEALDASGVGLAIPLNVRFTARGRAVVATSPDYYAQRGLRASAGTVPLRIGDATLGAKVALELGVVVGDSLFSDQRELYDISKPPALKLSVVGVLAPRGTADDEAVFVDTKTAWILEGLAHGHGDVETDVDESLVLERRGDNVAVSQAMLEHNEVTEANVGTFHYHGDTSKLPLSAILVFPASAKTGTLAKARMNAERRYRMLVPGDVIADLLGFVFRVKAFLDSFAGVLAATTVLLSALVVVLSTRLRAGEIETLDRIGSSRFTVFRLLAIEIGMILVVSAVIAAAGVAAARTLVPDLMQRLV
ncbi:MAG: hypothetical protein GY711_26275 [bacterium]|nr:hypothetical protein [bacterium]